MSSLLRKKSVSYYLFVSCSILLLLPNSNNNNNNNHNNGRGRMQPVTAFVPPSPPLPPVIVRQHPRRASSSSSFVLRAESSDSSSSSSSSSSTLPTVFNGKRVLPYKIIASGLKNQQNNIAAVYAVFNKKYKRGQEGWETCILIDISKDLRASLEKNRAQLGNAEVVHVRALSFPFPQKEAMEQIAHEWHTKVQEAPRDTAAPVPLFLPNYIRPEDYLVDIDDDDDYDDDEDDDDDDDDDDDMDAMRYNAISSTIGNMRKSDKELRAAASVRKTVAPTSPQPPPFEPQQPEEKLSPFEKATIEKERRAQEKEEAPHAAGSPVAAAAADTNTFLPFTKANVDQVLDEVRPYLISDGGNILVKSVDEEKGFIYVQLQGACGSCASSTVTMQMGVERILHENFTPAQLKEVILVEASGEDGDDEGGGGMILPVTELTYETVQKEVNRLQPAMMAMGGIVTIVSVAPETGEVEINFRGSNKIQKGLELALLDLEYCHHVKFIM